MRTHLDSTQGFTLQMLTQVGMPVREFNLNLYVDGVMAITRAPPLPCRVFALLPRT